MTDTSPALPPLALPPAPVSPDVGGTDLHGAAHDPALRRVLEAFRILQVRHTRMLAYQSALRGLGVTDTRFLLHLAAADGQGTTPKQAGDLLELSTGAMTSLLDRLERHGHTERRPNPGDRRSILVHLTPSGAAVARAVGDAYADAFGAAVAPADRTALAAALEAVGATLERRHRQATTP
ncbi:hypothetical protein DEJ23_06635 [Curtobacterium sp. MCSS17_008]|uniref:MarR family winged helix-turn-helix transcriptional regulator n=1 Tax=Curtobacterium sp. MCSS17_008 TaxID=2175647 RepID=UPI000DA753E2|nr:MarR family transcriptional regulator [Curtobacterium sp. MCSS17_008]PZF57810.1 hypothetical protein DEJ23_06635 [Curtobacterium sp. MCSS17_008]